MRCRTSNNQFINEIVADVRNCKNTKLEILITNQMSLNISRIRALCFDIDGTLSDTNHYMVAQCAKILHSLNFLSPRRNVQYVARRWIMTIENPTNFLVSISDTIGLNWSMGWLMDLVYRSLGPGPKKNFQLVPGTQEMLQTLTQRYPMAVVTSRGEGSTKAFLKKYNLLPYFKCIATAQTCKHTKPYPDPILWTAREMGVNANECLIIGDSSVDIRSGKVAGAQTVGVLCGFGSETSFLHCGADMILATPLDLVKVLDA